MISISERTGRKNTNFRAKCTTADIKKEELNKIICDFDNTMKNVGKAHVNDFVCREYCATDLCNKPFGWPEDRNFPIQVCESENIWFIP